MAFRSAANAVIAGLGAAGFIAAGAVAASTQASAPASTAKSPLPPAVPVAPMAYGPTAVPSEGPTSPTPSAEPTKPSPEPTKPSPEPTTPRPEPTTPSPRPGPGKPAPVKPRPKPTTARPTPAPELFVGLTTSSAAVRPGGSLTATVSVRSGQTPVRGARLRVSASRGTASPGSSSLGDITAGSRSLSSTVTIPQGTTPGTVTLLARVTAEGNLEKVASSTIVVAGDSAAVLPAAGSGTYGPQTTGNAPQVALPPVASPSLAPSQLQLVSSTALRSNKSRIAPGLAALQAGWLAALLAGNVLLIFRVRLIRGSRSAATDPVVAVRATTG